MTKEPSSKELLAVVLLRCKQIPTGNAFKTREYFDHLFEDSQEWFEEYLKLRPTKDEE